jgi:hypothetical protein
MLFEAKSCPMNISISSWDCALEADKITVGCSVVDDATLA